MSTKKMLSIRVDRAVIELLKNLARERGISQAELVRELVLREVYK
jgi:predicted DNA-binding protein